MVFVALALACVRHASLLSDITVTVVPGLRNSVGERLSTVKEIFARVRKKTDHVPERTPGILPRETGIPHVLAHFVRPFISSWRLYIPQRSRPMELHHR